MKSYQILIIAFIYGCKITSLPFDRIGTNPRCNDHDTCTADIWQYNIGEHDDTLHYGCAHLNLCYKPDFCDTVNCADIDGCTIDVCDSANSVCRHSRNIQVCNDNDLCTADVCTNIPATENVICSHFPYCNDQDLCTTDICTISAGFRECSWIPKECADFNCTNNECLNGICILFPVNCDDGYSCTRDRCIEKDGQCQNIDTCYVDPCTFDTIPQANNPTDWCKVTVCVNGNVYNTQRNCNDYNLCTNDICGANHCMNIPINCDDGTGTPFWCDSIYQDNVWYQICAWGACDDHIDCTWDYWNDVTQLCEFTWIEGCAAKMSEQTALVYPNPFTDKLFFQGYAEISDMYGRVIWKGYDNATLDVAAGMYFVRTNNVLTKVVKQ